MMTTSAPSFVKRSRNSGFCIAFTVSSCSLRTAERGAFADTNMDAQSAARRVVECFFDNVIIEATVQFVDEYQEALRQSNSGLEMKVMTASAPQANALQTSPPLLIPPSVMMGTYRDVFLK